MQIGFIGLGRMGAHMAEKLVKDKHDVLVWNRTHEKAVDFEKTIGGKAIESVDALAEVLEGPRVFWTMLPSGQATDEMLEHLMLIANKGDIIVNGANDHFKNTESWHLKMKEKGILFLGVGVSGGLIAATEGYPMMIGGDHEAYTHLKPIFDSMAKPNGGHEFFGPGGSGHYVKMVHNAIEYGIMQSIAEGLELLKEGDYPEMDLVKVTKLWQRGTLVSGFLLDRTHEALVRDPNLEKIKGYIDDTGEGRWAVQVALEHSIPLSLLTESLFKRYRSRQEDNFGAKSIAAMRNVFGGHAVKEAK